MFWLRSCPRCVGDVYDARDLYGGYLPCLQCGHYLNELEELAVGCMSWVPSDPGRPGPEEKEYWVLAGSEKPGAIKQFV